MLAVTTRAAAVIREMTNRETHPHSGLRITSEPGEDGFAVEIVLAAAAGDIVVNMLGANVYLDRRTASALAAATLVAAESGVGTARFAVVRPEADGHKPLRRTVR